MADCNRECWERIVRLEESTKERFESNKTALELAKATHDRDRAEAAHQLEIKMEGYNQWRQRFDKMEGTLVTVDDLDREVARAREHTDVKAKINSDKNDSLQKIVYIGVGVVLAFQFCVGFFIAVLQLMLHFIIK